MVEGASSLREVRIAVPATLGLTSGDASHDIDYRAT